MHYGVATRYLSTGLAGHSSATPGPSAKSYHSKPVEKRLPFADTGGCSHIEEGMVELTREQFNQAAQRGIGYKLTGRREVIVRVPPELFRQALSQ